MAVHPKLDYRIRPAKVVERKMMAEALVRLSHFQELRDYRYIGFGALYFRDFLLFHRTLGIDDMTSIELEANVGSRKRYEFNKPFRSVDIRFESPQVVLESIDWSEAPRKTILWLDYEGALDGEVLGDISTFCNRAPSGSVLIVTLNVHQDLGELDDSPDPLEQLKDEIGEARIPPEWKAADLAGSGRGDLTYRVVRDEISRAVDARMGDVANEDRLRFRQLFNFRYRDGARMLTIGGLLHRGFETDRLDACHFEGLPFVREADDPYLIEVPLLTFRELYYLDQFLPDDDKGAVYDRATAISIPRRTAEQYAAIYRYFPPFAEMEL